MRYLKNLAQAVCLALLLFASGAQELLAAANMPPMIIGPQLRVRIAVADPLDSKAITPLVQKYILENLSFLPFAVMVDPRTVPGGTSLPAARGPEVDVKRFQLAGAHLLITSAWFQDGRLPRAELRVYDVTTGAFVFGNNYSNLDEARAAGVADQFCSELMKAITGRGEFFRSTLAFVKSNGPNKRDIWTVTPTGRELRQISNMPGDALSPSWSPDGRFIVFGHVDRRTHALGVWDKITNSVSRKSFPGNTVIGPCFMPDNKVAVSMSTGRNPSIFLLDHQFRREGAIIDSASIDVSPSVDASGTKMAFTSSRMGNPHIFLKDLSSGVISRITYEGRYNTEPAISPDGALIAFSRQLPEGYRIFVYDMVKKTETQLTFGPGRDEQPSFGPDSYFIAFTSTRSGTPQIYLTTRNGGEAKRIPTGAGDAMFPRWGLTRK